MREDREIIRRKPIEKRRIKNINMRLTQKEYDAIMARFGSMINIRTYLLGLIKKDEQS